ncbi:unknown [[Mannheimia] succiniciproducens MBEL55E]|uniref:Uncharacterized protein n=1 Tax=Mannheimia succiniciproducens (strain KCTC 0769BP / MBEL55E) TaxID=221988 RepID=Q65W83_MANSM|nr:unknown [[Mannheimia] succiniciproducens MBEL55E]
MRYSLFLHIMKYKYDKNAKKLTALCIRDIFVL